MVFTSTCTYIHIHLYPPLALHSFGIPFSASLLWHMHYFQIAATCNGVRSSTVCFDVAGAVPMFVKMLSSQDATVVDQAVWALGNIAGTCMYVYAE